MTLNKTILVVGGAGYIGSHVVTDLKAQGYNPIIVDNFSTGNRDIAARVGAPIEEGDIGDEAFVERVLKAHKPSSVMHFAALALVGESVAQPAKYYKNNVAASLTLLECMLRYNIKNFIFSSTCATYGVPAQIPMIEDMPQSPINPYGHSKLMVERILKDFDAAYGLRSVIFRYFNASGAHPTLSIGERHNPESHLIPIAIASAYGRGPLSIYGADYDTPDGTCVRDYIHVLDISNAHLLGLRYLEGGGKSDAFNIGVGKGYSVKEVAAAVERVTKRKVPQAVGPRRPGDPPRLVAAATKLSKALGWRPQYPELDEIVRTAHEWHRKDWGI